MPSRSVVTRENLSRDFVVEAALPGGGCLRLNLSTQFTRDPVTGLISVTVGGVGISEDVGNIIEMRDDGLYAIAGAATVAVSEQAGNIIELLEDGLFAPPADPARPVDAADASIIVTDGAGDPSPHVVGVRRSVDAGNQIELRGDGLFVPASGGGAADPFGVVVYDLAEETGTPGEGTHTLLASDHMKFAVFRGFMFGAHIDLQSGTSYPDDFEAVIIGETGALITLSAAEGVTLNGIDGGSVRCGPMMGSLRIKRLSADRWIAVGAGTDEWTSALKIEADGLRVKVASRPDNAISIIPGSGPETGIFAGPPEILVQEVEIPSFEVAPEHAGMVIELGPTSAATIDPMAEYPPFTEYTIVRAGAFTFTVPAGATVNGVAGPTSYNVAALPGGIVLKAKDDGTFLLMGDATVVP